MTTQFIAHSDEPKTFAHKKGAQAAIRRDLQKHDEAHGDVLFETGFDVKPAGDRFGVVIYCDVTPEAARKIVGVELSGYVIEPQLKDEPKKADAPKSDDAPKPKKADAPKADAAPKRVKSIVEIEPNGLPLIPARHGSTQQTIIDLLARDEGATLAELVEKCVRKDGENWAPASLMAGLYHHIPHKGYGITTRLDDDGVAHYRLRYAPGIYGPIEPRRPQSQQTRLDRLVTNLKDDGSPAALKLIEELTDDQLLEKFANVTALKTHLAELAENT